MPDAVINPLLLDNLTHPHPLESLYGLFWAPFRILFFSVPYYIEA